MKTVYDIRNGSSLTAYDDPMDGGVIMPAFSTEIEPPDFDFNTQTCSFNDGVWVVTNNPEPEPEVINPPDDLMVELRMIRNGYLMESDFRVLPDYQGSDVEAWKIYRQALRDFPSTNPSPTWNSETGELENVNWPTPPSE